MAALLYDTHAHLYDQPLLDELPAVLQRAEEAGVGFINCVGCDWPSSLQAVQLAEQYPQRLRAVIGVHPSDCLSYDEAMEAQLCELARHPLVVAWGEIGLDYHYDDAPPRERQMQVFRAQLRAAKQVGLPVMVHDREAHQDVLALIKEENRGFTGGVLHCFSGSWEMARECLQLGWTLSFGGPVTYKNARVPVEVATKTPLERLVVETDCPYLPPEPYRGKVNEPAYVARTAARLAELRSIDYARLAEITTQNARAIFHV